MFFHKGSFLFQIAFNVFFSHLKVSFFKQKLNMSEKEVPSRNKVLYVGLTSCRWPHRLPVTGWPDLIYISFFKNFSRGSFKTAVDKNLINYRVFHISPDSFWTSFFESRESVSSFTFFFSRRVRYRFCQNFICFWIIWAGRPILTRTCLARGKNRLIAWLSIN